MKYNQWVTGWASRAGFRNCALAGLAGLGMWTSAHFVGAQQNTAQQNTRVKQPVAQGAAQVTDVAPPQSGSTTDSPFNQDAPPPALGVQISDREGGVFIADVHPGSPAGKAGIRRGDQIISIDGKQVNTPHEMIMLIQKQRKIEEQAKIGVRRDGKDSIHELSLLTLRPGNRGPMNGGPGNGGRGNADNRGWLGVVLQMPSEQESQNSATGQQPAGVVVKQVYPKGPAEKAGVRAGDTITSINGKDIKSPEGLINVMGPMQAKTTVDVVVLRGGQQMPIKVTLGGRTDFADLRADNMADGTDLPAYVGGQDPYSGDAAHDQSLMHRHLAEQHQRIENMIQELTGEVRALRAELAAMRGKPTPAAAAVNGNN